MLYTVKGTVSPQDTLTQYLPLVRKIATSIYRRINFTLELDDLIQCGNIGLMDAIHKYKVMDGVKFETYATTRIKGSILDEIRKEDPLTQDDRALYKKIQAATSRLKQHGSVSDVDIANTCGVTLDTYYHTLHQNQLCHFVSQEDYAVEYNGAIDEADNQEDTLQRKELAAHLQTAITQLSEREQMVMQLMYVEDFNAVEVADTLGISKARVSQLHSAALVKLKTLVGSH